MVKKSFLPMWRDHVVESQRLRQNILQAFDPVGEVLGWWRHFDKQMNMIGHQNIPADKNVSPQRLAAKLNKSLMDCLMSENRLPAFRAKGHKVNRIFHIQ